MDQYPALTFGVCAIGGTLLYRSLSRRSKPQASLPPGPKRLPIIGNFLDIPSDESWKQYLRWSKEYDSEIISLDVAGTPLIVVHSMQIARDLFESRGTIYSSRPPSRVVNDMIGWGWVLALLPYGEAWKERRRLFQKFFNPNNPYINQPPEQEYVHKLLGQLLDSPQDFAAHIRHMVGCLSISMTYGIRTKLVHDPYVEMSEHTVYNLAQVAVPGAFLADMLPIMDYIPEFLPGGGWKKRVRIFKEEMIALKNVPFDAGMKELNSGMAAPSFLSCSVQDSENEGVDRTETIKEIAGQTFIAGADTTTSAIMSFILAMVLYPEVQRKAREEIDRVVQGRLPQHTDRNFLPYVTAVVKETLRWQPPFPLGLPHVSTQEDVYKGHYIPKGSIVMANIRAMMYDEAQYPEPEKFKPERFFDDGKLNSHVGEVDAVFGFGRRNCPGQYISESTLCLTVASLLAVFEITKEVDANGLEITPPVVYGTGIIIHALPFPCRFKPRSPNAVQLIQNAISEYGITKGEQ